MNVYIVIGTFSISFPWNKWWTHTKYQSQAESDEWCTLNKQCSVQMRKIYIRNLEGNDVASYRNVAFSISSWSSHAFRSLNNDHKIWWQQRNCSHIIFGKYQIPNRPCASHHIMIMKIEFNVCILCVCGLMTFSHSLCFSIVFLRFGFVGWISHHNSVFSVMRWKRIHIQLNQIKHN